VTAFPLELHTKIGHINTQWAVEYDIIWMNPYHNQITDMRFTITQSIASRLHLGSTDHAYNLATQRLELARGLSLWRQNGCQWGDYDALSG